jgi:hypothetical protein
MSWWHQPLRSRPTIGTLACSIKCCSASSEPVGSPTVTRSPPSEHRHCALVSIGTTVTVTPLLLTTYVGAMHPTSYAMQPFSTVWTLDRQQPARAASATKQQQQRQHLWGRLHLRLRARETCSWSTLLQPADRMCSRYIVVDNHSTLRSQRCVLAASPALSVPRVTHPGYIMPVMRAQQRTCRRLLSALTLSFSSLTLAFSCCSSRLEGPPNRSIILRREDPNPR